MSFVRPSSVLLVVCLFYSLKATTGVIQYERVLPNDYYLPEKHFRVKRQAAPAPPAPFRQCPCMSNPCLNGGECSSVPGTVKGTIDFNCICQLTWTGTTCEVCPGGLPQCSKSCLAYKDNDVCNDGGPGSIDAVCPTGTDCGDCPSRC